VRAAAAAGCAARGLTQRCSQHAGPRTHLRQLQLLLQLQLQLLDLLLLPLPERPRLALQQLLLLAWACKCWGGHELARVLEEDC
jgi:hypothetical protein